MQLLEDAGKISDGWEHHFEPLSPVSRAFLSRPRNSASRRSGAPHKGTKKADFLASLSTPSKPSNQRSTDVVTSPHLSLRAQRVADKSLSTRRSSSSSFSLKSNSNHEVRRWSHSHLPTITEYQKCSFRSDKNLSRQRKASSCEDFKQRRKSSRSKEGARPSHSNATFDKKTSQKSTSLLSPNTRKSIQYTILDPSLFQVDDLESHLRPLSKSAHSRIMSSDDESVDDEEAVPTAPDSTRGIFHGAMEADMPRLPTRKKSERSIGL